MRAGLSESFLPPPPTTDSPYLSPLLSAVNGAGSLGGLGAISQMGQQSVAAIQSMVAPPPPAPMPADIGINPSTNELFVQGRQFSADDAQTTLDAEALLNQPGRGALPAGFQPLSPEQYGAITGGIRSPGRGTLAARNFGRGIDQLQMLGGRGLQLIGAEETGQRIVNQQVEDLRRTQPYERQFTDIESGGDAVDWFVANLAQQGPMLLEAIGAGAAGFFAGGAVGGPLGAAGGALAGLAGRTAFKQAVLAAARKKAAGEVLDQAESKILKSAAGLAGATAAATANSLQMGASDIYGELRDQGADADDVGARLTALFGSIPYAAMDLLPEYALASRVFGTAVRSGAQVARRGDMLRRAGKGLVAGAALEGSTEAGQEALLLGLSDQDFSDPKNIQRLVNSFAAGAAIGGPIGAVANLKRGAPANVLSGADPEQQMLALPAPPLRLPAPGAAASTEPGGLPAPDQQLALPYDRRALPDYTGGFRAPEGELDLRGGEAFPPASDFRPAQGEMFPVGELGQGPAVAADQQMELPFDQGVQRPQVQGELPLVIPQADQEFLPFDQGLPPPRGTQAEMFPGADLGVPPGQAALTRREVPPDTQLDLPLTGFAPGRDEQLEMNLVFDEEQGADAWRRTSPKRAKAGRPRDFRNLHPKTRQEWMWALRDAMAGKLDLGDLRRVRSELEAAHDAARLQGKEPRTVYQDPDLPPPTPPKGGKASALKKPKPTAVARTQPAGSGGQGLKRGAGGTTGQATGAPVAAATQPEAKSAQSVPVQQPKAEAVRKAVGPSTTALTVTEATGTRKDPQSGGTEHIVKLSDGSTVYLYRDTDQFGASYPQWYVIDPVSGYQSAGATESLGSTKAEALENVAKRVESKRAEKTKTRRTPPAPVREAVAEPTYASAEEAWDDMKPQGAPGLNEKTGNKKFLIPAMFRAQWQNIFKSGKASIERAKQVYDQFGSELNPLVQVRQAIALMEEDTRSISDEFVEAADTLVEYAFFTSEETNTKEAVAAARAALVPTDFSAKQWQAILDAFVAQANERKQRQATYVQGENKGNPQPWINFAFGNNLIKKLKVEATNTDSLSQEIKDALGVKGAPAPTSTSNAAVGSRAFPADAPLSKLAQFLSAFGLTARMERRALWETGPFMMDRETIPMSRIEYAEGLYARLSPEDRNASMASGYKISDFFKDDRLALEATESTFTGTTIQSYKLAPKTKRTGRFSLSAFNNPETSMSKGAIEISVGKFLSKLATKPSVRVYRNQADFMQRNPALYRKALAARPEGDFDTAQAAGYSFAGGNVIIFSDRIANEQHLNFVLAHETMGHFGLRGIIPNAKFNATMAQVYQSSPHVQADVDAYMAQGMSKEEAVEEYLSDFAGILDTSVVARIWNAIKTALNKLGVKFGDEMVRHLLKHSRSYVREGKSYIHQTDQVFTDMYMVENGYGPVGTGRFSSAGDFHAAQQTIVNSRFAGWQAPSDMAEGWRRFVAEVGPTANKLDRFVGQFLSLQVFRGRKNPGAQRLYDILQTTNGIATRVRVRSDERNRAIFNSPKKIQEQVSGLLYAAQSLAESRITDVRKLNGPPLFSVVDGVLTPNKDEIKRLKAAGRVTFAQAKGGFKYPVTLIDGSTRMEEFAGIEGLTEDDIRWKGYESLRESMDDAAIDLLRARYSATLADRKVSFRQFDELVEGKLTDDEKAFIDSLLNTYRDLYAKGTTQNEEGNTVFDRAAMQRADDFVVAVNRSILNLKEGYDTIEAQFKDQVPDDTVAKLRELSKRIKLGQDKFVVQTRMKQLMIDSLSTKDADLYTRRSLAIGYVPLLREGAYQLRLQAINPRTGQPVKLDETSRNKLVYMQMESESQVVRLADELNTLLSENGRPKRYTLKAYNPDTQQVEDTEVILRAAAERALDAVTGPPGFNLNEIQYGLRQLNINLTPAEVENVVVAMTRQNAAARNRLQRSNVPGAERDAIKAISKHIDSRASTIAKTEMRPYLNEVMNLTMRSTMELWQGSAAELKRLKELAESSGTTTDRRNYLRYKYMFETTNPEGGAKRGNEFYNEASRTVQFLNESRDVSTSNFESGATVARLRSFASAVQLGGSFAQMVMNFIGVYTNGIPFLATYNERNGFGGGFGAGAAVFEYHRALGQVGAPGVTNTKMNTAEFYADMSRDDLIKYGLTRNEANFIAAEIREGRMIPAQSNALLNTSRGYADSPFLRRFTEVWMAPFNVSEQAARRALGLAAFRLEFARQKSDGKTDQEAYDAASRFAAETLDVTMGEYGVLNRPPAWRGGIQTILYMYKVYPTTAIQLLANMDRKGQIAMLFALLMFAGLQGLPFAEDLEDIVDTIAQALGLTMGSIRAEGTKMLESALPGASVPLMQGVMNMVLPIDIGAKLGLGNLFPGTAIGLAGADVSRELQDIAGPMPAAIIQSGKTVYNALRLPFSDQVRLPDVLRETPVTMLRALGDTMAFSESGMVIDKRGYLITGDASISAFAARLTGFQPPDVGRQYGGVRISKRITDYQRDTVTMYRTAWVRAKVAGDEDAARGVEKAVAKWNEGAAGTGLRISNFMQGSQRALREAKRPVGERALRTTPVANREDIAAIYDMMGAT